MKTVRVRWSLVAAILLAPHLLLAEQDKAQPVLSDKVSGFLGIYESVAPGEQVPGGVAASPATLDVLPLTPAAEKAQSSARQAPDPRDLCQVLGPFRYMTRADVRFEILRDAPNKLVLVFENLSWGHLRTIALDADHDSALVKARPLWNGDSVATWDGDTLKVDSTHFTGRTWLNDAAVANSRQLHLVERFRLLPGDKVLEYQATATDPDVLAKPVSYTRYFKRTTHEIENYDCLAHKPAATPASR